MRPRPDAAENVRLTVNGEPLDGSASMRPRPDAAENSHRLSEDPEYYDALQ